MRLILLKGRRLIEGAPTKKLSTFSDLAVAETQIKNQKEGVFLVFLLLKEGCEAGGGRLF